MLHTDFSSIPSKELNKIKRNFKKHFNYNNLMIIIDSQEVTEHHRGWHVVDYLQKQNINFEVMSLNAGDFSFIYDDESFDDKFAIDRKAHVNELIGNFKEDRFNREIDRSKSFEYFSIGVELGSLFDIFSGNYRSEMKAAAAIGRIMTFSNYVQFDFLQGIPFGYYLIEKIYYFYRAWYIMHEIRRFEIGKKEDKKENST